MATGLAWSPLRTALRSPIRSSQNLRATGHRRPDLVATAFRNAQTSVKDVSRSVHVSSRPRNRPALPTRGLFRIQQRRLLSDEKAQTAAADTSLSGRLRKLSREYGWTALGVYLLLSALDFPFCFLAVRLLGTERIGRWEHAIVEYVKRAIPFQWPEAWGGRGRLSNKQEIEASAEQDALMGYDHGVKEAQQLNSGDTATIWTQLALAYAIHKSFIFVRVPLTAAVLPKVVKTLRGWGWKIGNRTPKSAAAAAATTTTRSTTAGPSSSRPAAPPPPSTKN